MNLEPPTYNTIQQEALLPVFTSSLVFNGVSYTGEAGKNKKEAEQLAARAVIVSLLGILFLYDQYEFVFNLLIECVLLCLVWLII